MKNCYCLKCIILCNLQLSLPIWLSPAPRRKSIRRESTVHQANMRHEFRILQISIVFVELTWRELPLINNRRCGQRHNVDFQTLLQKLMDRLLPETIHSTIELFRIISIIGSDKNLNLCASFFAFSY